MNFRIADIKVLSVIFFLIYATICPAQKTKSYILENTNREKLRQFAAKLKFISGFAICFAARSMICRCQRNTIWIGQL